MLLIISILFCSTAMAQYPYRSRIGYRPQIMWFPSGAYMGTRAVVGPNRRYVRIGMNVGFSGVTRVDTFNYVTGLQTSRPVRQTQNR